MSELNIYENELNFFNIKNIHCSVDKYLFELSEKIIEKGFFVNNDYIYYLSFLCSIISGYLIKKKVKILPGIFFFLSYFLNILYSNYIKKYKKTHVDNNLLILLTYIFILKTLYNKNYYAFIIVFILIIPTICNWGCQIQYIKLKYPEMYDIPIFNDMCEILCPIVNSYKKNIIFGNGSLILIISIYLAYL